MFPAAEGPDGCNSMVARARGWRLSAGGAIINDRLERGRSVPVTVSTVLTVYSPLWSLYTVTMLLVTLSCIILSCVDIMLHSRMTASLTAGSTHVIRISIIGH